MKTAVYGGTFNPLTPAHAMIIEYLAKRFDKVTIVPTTVNWYRKEESDDELSFGFDDRCEIIRAWLSDKELDNVKLSYIDSELDENHGFSDTLLKLKENAEGEFVVVIGADSYNNLHNWRRYQTILNEASILVINRPGYKVENENLDITPEVVELDMNISATNIRKDLKKILKIINEYPFFEYYMEGMGDLIFPEKEEE